MPFGGRKGHSGIGLTTSNINYITAESKRQGTGYSVTYDPSVASLGLQDVTKRGPWNNETHK